MCPVSSCSKRRPLLSLSHFKPMPSSKISICPLINPLNFSRRARYCLWVSVLPLGFEDVAEVSLNNFHLRCNATWCSGYSLLIGSTYCKGNLRLFDPPPCPPSLSGARLISVPRNSLLEIVGMLLRIKNGFQVINPFLCMRTSGFGDCVWQVFLVLHGFYWCICFSAIMHLGLPGSASY